MTLTVNLGMQHEPHAMTARAYIWAFCFSDLIRRGEGAITYADRMEIGEMNLPLNQKIHLTKSRPSLPLRVLLE